MLTYSDDTVVRDVAQKGKYQIWYETCNTQAYSRSTVHPAAMQADLQHTYLGMQLCCNFGSRQQGQGPKLLQPTCCSKSLQLTAFILIVAALQMHSRYIRVTSMHRAPPAVA